VRAAGQRGGGAAGQKGGGHRRGAQPFAQLRAGRAPFVHPVPATLNPLQSAPIEFVGSFPDPQVRVDPPLPEIAFIGRSNVGKSSLLNALVGRPGLARVSGSPGKTTLLNFYRLPELYLVDLPGYGFARASKSDRAGYRRLVTGYLGTRMALAGIVWLLDIRRDPSKDDREMQELLVESGRPVLPVFTKADKLTRVALGTRERELARALGVPPEQIQITSSRSSVGIAELASSIVAAAKGEHS
jgi:GTP-binding protein